MQNIIPVIIFLSGAFLGFIITFILMKGKALNLKKMANELYEEKKEIENAKTEVLLKNVESIFQKLSFEALRQSNEEFLNLAKTKLNSEREISTRELDSKKSLIDQQLIKMNEELNKVSNMVTNFENDRNKKFGELTESIKNVNQQTLGLRETTESLRKALSSSQKRGQWGERMAEDVLRFAGFIENINYIKQKTLKSSGTRPDFTFIMPRDLFLNMDVKFPLDNYLKFLESENKNEKEKYKKDFLNDIKIKIKEVTSRDYINPNENTVDYVLLFIPNEQIYSFIHEQDRSILDEALKNKVILCSPITLLAVLAVIRQAVENFALEKTSNEILSLFGSFKKQWVLFKDKFDLLGERLNAAVQEYELLTTTRSRQLDKPLNKIENLRTQKILPLDEKDK